MSTTSTVYQGLQSCLEPLLIEPRILMHQLIPSKLGLSPFPENMKNGPIKKVSESNRNGEDCLSCWNIMQSPTTSPSYGSGKSTNETEEAYVHPLTKRSASSLSTRSLEMCTESLGSETGSCITDEFTYRSSEKQSSIVKSREAIKKVREGSSFPPPLTSMSGNEGVHVQIHRQGGRLVIKAFSFSSSSTFFQAERGDGRLRLSLLRDAEREGENQMDEDEDDERGKVDDGHGDEGGDEGDFQGLFWEENMRDDGGRVGWSSSRCNGDRSCRKRLQSLPFWVAIS